MTAKRTEKQAKVAPHRKRVDGWNPLLLAVFIATSASSRADEGSGLEWFVDETIRHESNLLRLPAGSSSSRLGGRSYADTVNIATLGARFEKTYGLQNVHIEAAYIDYRYQNFSYLNFGTFNYRANWGWAITPRFHGNVSTQRRKLPNNAGDTSNVNRIDQRNDRLDTSQRLDGIYELGARWHVVGALARYSQRNTIPLVIESASRQTTGDLGLRYVLPSGSLATLTFRTASGSYTDSLSDIVEASRRFDQKEVELDTLWRMTAKTSLGLRIAQRDRNHPLDPVRNFDGMRGMVRFNWSATPRVTLASGWIRDLEAFQSSYSTYFKSDRVFVEPTWQISDKTRMNARFAKTERGYEGPPDPSTAIGRHDTEHELAVGVEWRPRSFLSLRSAIRQTRRESTRAGIDYKNTSIGIGANMEF